jgi:hypothetical protein
VGACGVTMKNYSDFEGDLCISISKKKFNAELFEAVKQTYRNNGYIEEKDFPGEYYFMYNPITCEQVRLYYHGKVQEEKV